MNIVCFTKNRPLQLQSALESFFFYTDFQTPRDRFYVITPEINELYKPIFKQFPIDVIEDKGNFDKVFRDLINSFNSNEFVTGYCDDQIITRFFKFSYAQRYLSNNLDTIGFSFRLGLNLRPVPKLYQKRLDEPIIFCQWPTSPSHFGIQGELMATIYRAELWKNILNNNNTNIKIPNYFESMLMDDTRKMGLAEIQPFLAFYKMGSCTFAQDINRVQDIYPNRIQGKGDYSSEKLIELYKEGKKIDWTRGADYMDQDIFVGDKYWSLY